MPHWEDEDALPEKENLNALKGPFVEVFLGATTFEREIVLDNNLEMLAKAARAIGAPRVASKIELAAVLLGADEALKKSVLNTAKRFGKARFAQLAAANLPEKGAAVPKYVEDAVNWLLA